jgi:gliding motility-associated-like protein
MRPISLNLIFLGICLLSALHARSQVCNGSLGDPVINQTFGAGPNPGPALSTDITNMKYVTSNCPNDGEYTIAHSLTDTNNCHPYTWFNVPYDHTGNPNGYMMIVNASYEPSVFFTQHATGLCPNTTYEFSAYILNLLIPSLLTADNSEPNITFTIETTSGKILATDTTGTIPPTPYHQGPTWNQYGTYFTTPANVTDVIVVMTNNAPGGNGNDFILDDITFRACGPVILEGFDSTAGVTSKSICQGSNAAYTLKAQVIGNGTPVLQWQSSSTSSPWTDIPGATADSLAVSFVNAKTNKYQYRLGVANGSGITDAECRVYSPPLTVTVNPLPVVPLIADQTVCEGYTLQLQATGGANYTWTGPNIPPTLQNPLIINNVTPANAGTYTVQAMSDSGCVAAAVQTHVTVIPKVVPVLNNATAEICAGQGTQLMASGGIYYKWTPSTGLDHDNISNPLATPVQTTKYTVDISNGACDDSTKSVTVTVNQNPVANAGKEVILFEGQSASLNGTIKGDSITSYYWTPATFLDNPASLTPTLTPTDNITYTLTAVSKTCGISTSSVFVRVYKKISIPNTFTPNNDGINDYWNVKSLNTYPDNITRIFDRAGQQVFESKGYSQPWDGAINGVPLPEGTYYYVIDLKIGTPKITGWVLIVR